MYEGIRVEATPLPDSAEGRGEDVSQSRHRTRMLHSAQPSPHGEVVENLDSETRRTRGGAARTAYRGTYRPQLREVDKHVTARQEAQDFAPGRVPNALDRVEHLNDLHVGRRLLALHEPRHAVTLGRHLVAHEVEVRAALDRLVVRVSAVDGQVEIADLARKVALGRNRVEVEAVAATDLGHQR